MSFQLRFTGFLIIMKVRCILFAEGCLGFFLLSRRWKPRPSANHRLKSDVISTDASVRVRTRSVTSIVDILELKGLRRNPHKSNDFRCEISLSKARSRWCVLHECVWTVRDVCLLMKRASEGRSSRWGVCLSLSV